MQTYHFNYPRRRFLRRILKIIGKLILPLFFKIKLEGFENFPKNGRLIIVANHYAVMEAVLIVIYAPYLIEFMGSVDVPHDKFTNFFFNLYQVIPVYRGKTEQGSFKKAIEILKKEGQIGIFPEGGHFDPGHMQAQSGVAWMSHKAQAPVLPIGISGSVGSLGQAFKFKRPPLKMKVGQPIPPLQIEDRKQRKTKLKQYANNVMDKVSNLLTEEELAILHDVQNEHFEIKFNLLDAQKNPVTIPESYNMEHTQALVELLYKKIIFKIYRKNYQLPIDAIEKIHTNPPITALQHDLTLILNHLNDEDHGNPYLLSYRFAEKGYHMQLALEEMLALTNWCLAQGHTYTIQMRRIYHSQRQNKTIHQIKQERID